MERCESGRIGQSRKLLSGKLDRGFESHPLRHIKGACCLTTGAVPPTLETHGAWIRTGVEGDVSPAWRAYEGAGPSVGARKRNTFARLRMPILSAPVCPHARLPLGSPQLSLN